MQEKKSRAGPMILFAAASHGNPFVATTDWEMVEEPLPKLSLDDRRPPCCRVRYALADEEEKEGGDVFRSCTV
ncbi:unnamed protein product [Linum trigynum]|uniref:Uncharacterized protein n=1 Tax=Linum trigynum TaxID=586398 RepID=A0AAV2CSM9_9ROSI